MKHKFIFPIKLNKKLHIVIMCKFLFWEIDATKFVKSNVFNSLYSIEKIFNEKSYLNQKIQCFQRAT